MQPLREKRENIKSLLKKLHDTPSSALQKLPCYRKKRALQLFFIFTVVLAMFFSEFVLAIASPNRTLQAYAYFLDNTGGNGVANALGKLTITERAHMIIKGSGHYTVKIKDSHGAVLLSKAGDFNKTGYAEVVFTLSPSKFRVGEMYYAYITAEDNPFLLFYRYAETKISFKIHKDYPVIGLGAVRDGNQTLITTRILTGAGPLKNKKIWFGYKIYNKNETLKTLGHAFSDNNGRAVFVTNALNESQLYLIVAEFYGDDMYMPTAASQAYLPVITAKDYAIHDALMNVLNTTIENSYVSQNQVKKKASASYGKIGRAVLSGTSYKTSMTADERFKKVTASDRIKSNTNSDYKFKFTEEDLASLSLVEFLKRITTDDTPASALINIANILMNLDNVPFVLEQTQELLSKLQVPLIPDVAHSSLTEIRLYRTKSYIVNVEKTVAEKHVETYTVTKKVSKKVKYTEEITKKIKVRVQYIYYQKIVRKEMAFVRRPRPHWQIVYVVTYKPIIKWKYVWKTVMYTVTKYKTVWSTVTETKTRVYYTYKTVTEKVKKEKREYFRILITKGFTVINEQTNEKMTFQQFFLFVMGFREDALGQIINYLEAKVFGPALNILQQFIDFLINVSKRFLRTLVENLFEEIKSLVFQGLMLHMVKYSNNKNDGNEKENSGISNSKSGGYRDYLFMSAGPKYRLARADRPYNIWDSFYKLHARRTNDMAESTKLTIELSVLEAKAEYFITGEETVVVIPMTSEVLVYNTEHRRNNEPKIGWLDLNHYDHTIVKYGEFKIYDWRNGKPAQSKKEMGYIPLGVTRTTYIILLPDATSGDGRKMVVGYSIDVVDDNTKLVPDILKEFPELAESQKIKNEKAKRISKSFNMELKDIKNKLDAEHIETYRDLRNAIASKYEPNIQELIEVAVENSKVSGIGVGEVKSGGIKSQFFIINKDYKWTDSEGNEHTPIEIDYSYLMAETGSDSKYKEASRVLLGIMGKKNRKSIGPVEEQFADVHKGIAVAEKIFDKISDIAKTNDIPANGVLRVISPSLLDKVDDIRVIGESDEFHNNANSITIVDPTLANPIAALYLDYFRAFAENEFVKTYNSLDKTSNFKAAQIRIFRESIIDAYRIAILFHKDPKEIKFKFKYKEGERIESAEVSLEFLIRHESEFAVMSGSKTKNMYSIRINNKDVPVDKIVEGFMHLEVKQDNVNHKVILQPLDENLNPIENKQIVFDFQEKVTIDKKGRKRYVRHIILSDDKALAKIQKDFLGDWSVESMLLVHGTLYACFKDMFRENPELESRFIKLLGDAEHLGQNPAKSAAYLVFFLLQDTKGGEIVFVSAKRYMITLLKHERKLAKLKSDLDELLKDPERLSKLTPEELKSLKETYEKIDTELKKLRERIIVFLEEHFNSMKKAKEHENKIVICMEVTKRYLERLLGGKEGIKSISKNIAIGTLVGLIFPRVVAETIMTLDMSILEEILARDAKTFAALMSNKELQLGIGLSLSAITFALLNLDIHRFMKAGTAGATRTAGTAGTSSHANHHTHKSSIIGEFFGQLFDIKMILATFLSGFGMILKALADAPFYTTEEIAEEISKQVHEKLGETAGVIWDMTAGYRIPGLDMTGFEVALTVLLQGNGGVIQLITTAVTKAVEYMIAEVIKPLVEPVIAEYTYYMVDALAA